MKKKFLFALTASTITAAAAVALMPHAGVMSFAEGCEHEGNHYEAVAATCGSAGNKEFWACCVCHEQFVTAPGKGTWEDKGAYAGPALASTHAAYLAPLEHTPGDWNIYDRGDSLGVNASCSDCGEACFDEDVNTVAKPNVSTAEWDAPVFKGDGKVPFVYNEEAQTFTINNTSKTTSYGSAFQLNITKSGKLVFDVEINVEVSYDYLVVYQNTTISSFTSSSITYGGNGSKYYTYGKGAKTGYTETVSLDVNVGDVITFAKKADGSGWGTRNGVDADYLQIKLATSYTASLVTFDSQGGSSVYPGIALNGMLATSLPTPTKDGYVFDGWFKSTSWTEQVEEGGFVGENATLYAKWWDESQRHPLEGTYKGFGFKANGARSDLSILSNVTFTVNFKGEVACNNSYWYATATKFTSFEDGAGTLGSDVSFEYDEATGTIVTHKASLFDDYGFIFLKDSTQQYTTSLVKNCGFGNATVGNFAYYDYPAADGSIKHFYAVANPARVYLDVTLDTLREVEVAANKLTSSTGDVTGGFQIKAADDSVIETFGYDGSSYVPSTSADADAYYGKYTNSASGDTEQVIYVTGHKRFFVDSSTSAKTYTITDNVIHYTSGHDAVDYTLDKTTMTFTRNVPTVTITYNLNGHAAALEDGSGVFKLSTNTQLACKGAWLYSSDLAKVVGNKSTDGEYLFEGWYKDAACTQEFAQCSPTEDLELFAKWTKMYTVTLVLNNGEDDRVLDVKGGNTPSITNPTKDGWMFAGWFTDPECTQPYVPGAMTESITLYASWVEQPDFAKGKYQGYNCYGDNKNATKSSNSSYSMTFDANGNIFKDTTKKGTYSPTEDVSDGLIEAETGKYIGVSNKYNNRYIMTSYYGGPSDDPVPGDMLFAVQTYGSETVSFVQTTLNTNHAYLVKVIVSGSENAETFYAYVDCDNNKVYAGVTLSVTRGTTVTSDFADVYASGNYADAIAISVGDTTVGVWGKNGSTTKRGDTYAGSYTGTFNGTSTTLVLNGFGTATCGELTGTYVGSGSKVTVTFGGKAYEVTLDGNTFTQVLDGYEGTYSGPNGALVVTGWGECTLNGVAGTYTESSTNVLKVVAGETYFLSVDKAAGTYTAASASPFAGYTFVGTSKDTYGDDQTVRFEFDDSPAITGTVQFGGSSFRATFSGTFVGGVLTLTLTSDIYSNGIVGKTATFAVADGKITCTATQLTSGMYRVDLNAEFTCAGFVAPTTGETDPEPTPDPEPTCTFDFAYVAENEWYDEAVEYTISADAANKTISFSSWDLGAGDWYIDMTFTYVSEESGVYTFENGSTRITVEFNADRDEITVSGSGYAGVYYKY